MKVFPLITVLVLMAAIGCKSYTEGPGFTLRKAETRIANVWAVDKAYDHQGADITDDYDNDRFLYREDGVLELEQDLGGSFQPQATSTWKFINDEDQVATYIDGAFTSAYDTLAVMRLTKDEYWYTNRSGFEFRLVPATSQ
jgi:hypothetical protein